MIYNRIILKDRMHVNSKTYYERVVLRMSKFIDRSYYVKESVPIYYTKDMDKTVKWFKDILGWYGDIIDRNDDGVGVYGFVSDMPKEQVASRAVPFYGFHMWHGESLNKTLALIQVQGINSLYKYVKKNGWSQISDIHETACSPKTCNISTPDGSVLTFFE